jgi:hypothetical protein
MKPNMKPQNCTDYLDKGPKQKKMDMRFGTWNVRVCIGQVLLGQWQKKSQNIS